MWKVNSLPEAASLARLLSFDGVTNAADRLKVFLTKHCVIVHQERWALEGGHGWPQKAICTAQIASTHVSVRTALVLSVA